MVGLHDLIQRAHASRAIQQVKINTAHLSFEIYTSLAFTDFGREGERLNSWCWVSFSMTTCIVYHPQGMRNSYYYQYSASTLMIVPPIICAVSNPFLGWLLWWLLLFLESFHFQKATLMNVCYTFKCMRPILHKTIFVSFNLCWTVKMFMMIIISRNVFTSKEPPWCYSNVWNQYFTKQYSSHPTWVGWLEDLKLCISLNFQIESRAFLGLPYCGLKRTCLKRSLFVFRLGGCYRQVWL